MWSTAYGLIALAVVAFVVLYAASHAPSFASVNLADQLYRAKSQLASNLSSLPRTDKPAYFRVYSNIVRIEVANATYGNYSFPVELPLGYRLAAEGNNLLYEIYLDVETCRPVSLRGGGAAVLYVVELRQSVDVLPWLAVYYADVNAAAYYGQLYGLYRAWGRPPAVGLDLGASLSKAEWALVYNATSGSDVLYVAAPPSSPYIVVEDYPLAIPLACPR
jgi:hypothetical protein